MRYLGFMLALAVMLMSNTAEAGRHNCCKAPKCKTHHHCVSHKHHHCEKAADKCCKPAPKCGDCNACGSSTGCGVAAPAVEAPAAPAVENAPAPPAEAAPAPAAPPAA